MGFFKHLRKNLSDNRIKAKKVSAEIRQQEQESIQKIFTITDIGSFDNFFENKIIPLLEPLEEKRKKFGKKSIGDKLLKPCIILPLLFFIGFFINLIWLLIPIVIIVSAIRHYLKKSYIKSYRYEFLHSPVLKNIAEYAITEHNDIDYSKNQYINSKDYDIYNSESYKSYDVYTGRDYFHGKINGTAVRFSFINVSNIKTVKKQLNKVNNDPRYPKNIDTDVWDYEFNGVLFICDFNKEFSGRVNVQPKGIIGERVHNMPAERFYKWQAKWLGLDMLHSTTDSGRRNKGLIEVKLTNPELDNKVEIFTTDHSTADNIISPNFEAKILDCIKIFPKNFTKDMLGISQYFVKNDILNPQWEQNEIEFKKQFMMPTFNGMSFVDSKLYFAISTAVPMNGYLPESTRSCFHKKFPEPENYSPIMIPIKTTLLDSKLFYQYYITLRLAVKIVDILGLGSTENTIKPQGFEESQREQPVFTQPKSSDSSESKIISVEQNGASEISRENIKCPSCSSIIEADDRFCPNCGTAVAAINQPQTDIKCPNCGTENTLDAKFCENCGRKLIKS